MTSSSGNQAISVSCGVDIDAVAGCLRSYGGEDSPDDISLGLSAGEVGAAHPRAVDAIAGDLTSGRFPVAQLREDTCP